MTFEQLKKELRIESNKSFAEWFLNSKSEKAWNTSSAKDRRQNGIINFYNHIKDRNRIEMIELLIFASIELENKLSYEDAESILNDFEKGIKI